MLGSTSATEVSCRFATGRPRVAWVSSVGTTDGSAICEESPNLLDHPVRLHDGEVMIPSVISVLTWGATAASSRTARSAE